MIDDKLFKALMSIDHRSLLMILPFECGYSADAENNNIADKAALNLAMVIQHINHVSNPAAAYTNHPIN